MEARKPTVSLAEVECRLALPLDQWEPAEDLSEVTAKARTELARLRGEERGHLLDP
jgi:hypothetical protein